MKAKKRLLFVMVSIMMLLCSSCALLSKQDPALTGHEPREIPESIEAHFAAHYDLLAQAADHFLADHQVFDGICGEWDASSGFFASDMEARAIKEALGQDGMAIVRDLNEKAYLRSMAYYIPTENRAAALLFGFFPQDYAGNSVLICISPAASPAGQAEKVENTISLISEQANHARLIPLDKPGWYYRDDSNDQAVPRSN